MLVQCVWLLCCSCSSQPTPGCCACLLRGPPAALALPQARPWAGWCRDRVHTQPGHQRAAAAGVHGVARRAHGCVRGRGCHVAASLCCHVLRWAGGLCLRLPARALVCAAQGGATPANEWLLHTLHRCCCPAACFVLPHPSFRRVGHLPQLCTASHRAAVYRVSQRKQHLACLVGGSLCGAGQQTVLW